MLPRCIRIVAGTNAYRSIILHGNLLVLPFSQWLEATEDWLTRTTTSTGVATALVTMISNHKKADYLHPTIASHPFL
jgi:hypothetical protein